MEVKTTMRYCLTPVRMAITKQSIGTSLVAQLVKNPPANAGDTGSIPGLGGSHVQEAPTRCGATKPTHHNY